MLAYDIPKRTQQDLLDEKEYKDFKDNVELNPNGLPNHLLLGHGMKIPEFEKRDIATTKNLSYDFKQSAKEILAPMTFHQGNTTVGKIQINCKNEDSKNIFTGMNTKGQIKPRGYNEYTKKCDANYLKIGLRS